MAMLTREQALVKKIKEWSGSTYIGDDCAVLSGGLLVSTDTLVEGTHFRLDFTDWRRLGWKSCAVNLSDIAAMAGRPRYLTVALTLPADTGEENIRQFYSGFVACAKMFNAEIVGGDLTVGREVAINVTVIGDSHEAGLMLRSGAKPGDVVLVTGHFGASAAGLQLLLSGTLSNYAINNYSQLLAAHLEPQPRLSQSWALVRLTAGAGALMDASDGLADALYQIAEQSHVDIDVDMAAIPLSSATSAYASELKKDPLAWALYGGEDYELVATIPAHLWLEGQSAADGLQFPFKKIGDVIARSAKVNAQGEDAPQIRLLENGAVSERSSGVVDLNNCFKHFC